MSTSPTRDESGAALVDDDFVAILPKPGAKLPANDDASIVAVDGQQVAVCGRAERRVLPELGQVGRQQGYRGEPRVLERRLREIWSDGSSSGGRTDELRRPSGRVPELSSSFCERVLRILYSPPSPR